MIFYYLARILNTIQFHEHKKRSDIFLRVDIFRKYRSKGETEVMEMV